MKDYFITLWIASRKRPQLLERCIKSFIDNAFDAKVIQLLLLVDRDDQDSIDLVLNLDKTYTQNLTIIIRKQGDTLVDYYNNYAAQCSNGHLIWGLNDECECIINHWDYLLLKRYTKDILPKQDKVFYLIIDDDSHYKNKTVHELGCCFPILTKEAVQSLGFFMPPQIEWQGADVALFKIFKTLMTSFNVERILMCDNVKVTHFSYNNGDIPADETQLRSYEISKTTGLNPAELEYYATILYKKIMVAILRQPL